MADRYDAVHQRGPVPQGDQFPKAFKDYIAFLERELETPIKIISIGPDRAQTIVRK